MGSGEKGQPLKVRRDPRRSGLKARCVEEGLEVRGGRRHGVVASVESEEKVERRGGGGGGGSAPSGGDAQTRLGRRDTLWATGEEALNGAHEGDERRTAESMGKAWP